jgi:hypothetical protein
MNQNFEYHGVQFLLPRVAARSPNMKKRRRKTELLGLSKLNDFSKRNKMHVSCMCMCHVAKAHEGTPHIKIAICNYEGNMRDLLI